MNGKMTIMLFLAFAPLCRAADHDPLTLEECRRAALDRNAPIRNADLDRLAAVERRREAVWEYLPRVSAVGGAFYSMDPMIRLGLKDMLGTSPDALALISEMHNLAYSYGISPFYNALDKGGIASVSVAQPVFAGGRIINGNRLAALGVEAASLQKDIRVRDVLEDVDKAWWDVISLQEKEVTLLTASEMLDSLCKDVSCAVAAGLASPEDGMQAELQRSDVRSKLSKVRRGIVLAKMNLCSKAGIPYIGDILLEGGGEELLPPDSYWRDEDELLALQKESRLLEISERAKLLERRMTLGESLPTIAVGGAFGYSNMINASVNGTLYATVRIPITDWGKAAHRVRRAGYEHEKAKNDREDLNGQILLKIRLLWMEAVSAWDELAVARENCDLLRRRADLAEAGYSAGMSTLSELLQARTALRQSEDSLSDARIAYRIAIGKYRNLQLSADGCAE